MSFVNARSMAGFCPHSTMVFELPRSPAAGE